MSEKKYPSENQIQKILSYYGEYSSLPILYLRLQMLPLLIQISMRKKTNLEVFVLNQ